MTALRSRLASLYWRMLAALRRLAVLPGRLHAGVYIALRLHRLYHSAGLSANAQLRFMPSQLWVSRRLMQQPYWVRVADIRWGGRPDGGAMRAGPEGLGCGLVFDGDWDLGDKQPLDGYLCRYIYSRTVFELFKEGLAPSQTEQYAEMSSAITRGDLHDWRLRGCRSEADVERHFEEMRSIYASICTRGYASQQQLGSRRWFDEIKLFIDRNGELHKLQGAGHHRLAMAKLAGVEVIPVLIVGVHRRWALAAQQTYDLDVLSSVDRKIRDTVACAPGGKPESAAGGGPPRLARQQADEAALGPVGSPGRKP